MPLRNSPYLPVLLAGISMIAPFAIDTYLPAFHTMARVLDATPVQMQQTLSAYLAAFGGMLLFHGALSDAFGRRPVILTSLAVFTLASAACMFVSSIHALIVLRVLQGCTGGAGVVVGRAIIRDLHEGPQAQRMMSQVTMWFSLAPAVAPVIGGYLLHHLGWHAIFGFMALSGLLLLLLCQRHLPETLPPEERQLFEARPLLHAYAEVLGDPRFLLLSLTLAANFAAFFLYIASAPAFVGDLLHQDETRYAWLFLPGIAGISLGAWLSGRVAGHWSRARTIQAGFALTCGSALLNLVGNAWHAPALPWAVLPIMSYTTGMALVMPSVTLILLDFFPHNRGMAASLQNCMATLLNAFLAGVVSPLLSVSGLGLAGGMAGFSAAGLVCWLAYWHHPQRLRTVTTPC
ncbi:MAG: multidrug effflux MFS transporter [Pseudomonadota bacterium]|nr:multidrug effflux MFS transporter [Pseudomonadota bacterium]